MMGRYQLTITISLIICSVLGLFGIGRAIFVGMDAIAWASLGSMFIFAWAARTMILHMPIASEAKFRVRRSASWVELSHSKRRILFWIDWPLFTELRNAEASRLWSEPLVSVHFDTDGLTLKPLSEIHTERYFLMAISTAAEFGLVASSVRGPNVHFNWRGADRRIWDHLNSQIDNRSAVSLRVFRSVLEDGYLNTLSKSERSAYLLARAR